MMSVSKVSVLHSANDVPVVAEYTVSGTTYAPEDTISDTTELQTVVGALESQSGPGSLHENTMLLVMRDHGQTLNGDHGGGTAEEVETAIFALTMKKPQNPLLTAAGSSSCQLDVHGRQVCTNSIQQYWAC